MNDLDKKLRQQVFASRKKKTDRNPLLRSIIDAFLGFNPFIQ